MKPWHILAPIAAALGTYTVCVVLSELVALTIDARTGRARHNADAGAPSLPSPLPRIAPRHTGEAPGERARGGR